MDEPLVTAIGISRCFGEGAAQVRAVVDVSCVINSGNRIALVGSSGSGKSTLLHLLGGLDVQDGGSLAWPALGPRLLLRPGKVTDIFQGPSLLPPLTVFENVRLPLVLSGSGDKEATESALLAIEAFHLLHLRNALPEELSGGQAQRVSIARAIAGRPALIMPDEPTGQLDSSTASDVLKIILDYCSKWGTAIVLATHDPSVAERMEYQWTMRDGHLSVDSDDEHLDRTNSPVSLPQFSPTSSGAVQHTGKER